MKKFAKNFEVADQQVLFYKDFEHEPSGKTTYQLVDISQHESANARIAHGYKSEKKRDAYFDKLTEEDAHKHLDAISSFFGN